jgi:hypothetical protein
MSFTREVNGTIASCVVTGERVADLLKATHGLSVAALAI